MNFIAFDLETTGFLPKTNHIIEVGFVKFIDGKRHSSFSELIDPKVPIPPEASAVNGIYQEMVEGKPTIDKLLKPIAEFCGDYLLVAHNAPFDYQFLKAFIEKYESSAPKGIVVDTLAMSRKVLPGLPNYKLGTLAQTMGIDLKNAHRAEDDAECCGRVFMKIAEKITGSPCKMPPLENMIALSGKNKLEFPRVIPKEKQLGLF